MFGRVVRIVYMPEQYKKAARARAKRKLSGFGKINEMQFFVGEAEIPEIQNKRERQRNVRGK